MKLYYRVCVSILAAVKEWKHSPTTTQRDHSSRPFPTTCTPSEVRPGDLSISTLFTVSPNTTGNTSTNIHTLKNTSNISHHTLQCKPVPSHSQGVQSLSQQRRNGIQSGPSPLSHSLKSSHQTIATPRLTLTELDDLWKKFLASSLASTQLRDENSQPTCTCGTVGENQTRDEHLTTSDSSHHATKISERPGKHGDSRKVKRDYLSRRKHRSTHRKESLLKECAVQTSPQPPEDHSPAPPVTFSLPPDGKGGVQISHLTLSEALAVQYPEFIERSLQRQRKLREYQRDGYHRSLGQYTSQDRPTPVWRTGKGSSHVIVHFVCVCTYMYLCSFANKILVLKLM